MYTLPQPVGPLSPNRFSSPFVQSSLPATPGAVLLDAADGVLDGKYFGSPIIDAGRAPLQSGGFFPSAAAALDAADGVMDGKFFGHRIIGQTAVVPTTVTVPYSPVVESSPVHLQTSVLPSSFIAPQSILAPSTIHTQVAHLPPPVTATSVILPPTEMSVITNVPPLGTTSVSVVDCHSGIVSQPAFSQQLVLPPASFQVAPPSFSTFSQQLQESQTTIVQRELPGAAAFAAEFRDLRAMLDRDRDSFEATRSQFERSLAERELKLKMDEEKLNNEWARFRSEEEAFKKKNDNTITVKTLQEGQALDVKDGIIDGKFNGKQIIVEGHGPLKPPPHLMNKPVPPPGKGGKGMPPGKGGVPPGKGMPLPGKGGKGGVPPGKGGPPGAPGAPVPAGKGAPPPPGLPLGKGGKGGLPGAPLPGPGAPLPGKGGPLPGKGGPLPGKGGPLPGKGGK